LKCRYKNEQALIDQEIVPNINKKMDHIGICIMQELNEDNFLEYVMNLSDVLKWLLQCQVGYVTIYFENIGQYSTYDLKSWLGNTLVKEVNHNQICWSNQTDQSRLYNMTVNIIEKERYSKDFNNALKSFIAHEDLTSLQSSLKNIARQNEKVKIFTDYELAKNSQVVNHLKKQVHVFKPMSGDKANFDANSKSYFEHCNCDMLMLFTTRGIELGGFPNIMREFCEIVN
jgi:hypothetical protein